ncbi:MAG: LAGLIDADG family homing endonuclease [Candidatus Taylorbacteria bacterium]|nr:LAGLIDADG family homing endonuclease [Candidatus Taylorbacteria bacterium]
MYFIGNRRAVRGYQHNYKILLLVKTLLSEFDIDGHIDKKHNEIVISRKKNLEKFARQINFAPGLCVNGKRSNSVWNKSREKRNILKSALASYQNK